MEDSNVKLTEDENSMLEKVAKATIEYLKSTTENGEVGILWYGTQHQDIIYISCKKWGVSNYAEHAKVDYSAGYYSLAYKELGYASHYLTDIGNPLHTGREGDQILNPWVHDEYEDYVYDNWNTGYNFKSVIENNWYYYSISDPKQSTMNLAGYSHQYVDYVYLTIYYNRYTFREDPVMRALTENCLEETAKYTLGLVKYIEG